MSYKSLIINPGSTSTKIGVFEDETLLFEETLRHPTEEISKYASIIDQKDFRKEIITDLLKEKNFDINSLDFVVGRGGLLKPIPGGTYKVSDELLHDLEIGYQASLQEKSAIPSAFLPSSLTPLSLTSLNLSPDIPAVLSFPEEVFSMRSTRRLLPEDTQRNPASLMNS